MSEPMTKDELIILRHYLIHAGGQESDSSVRVIDTALTAMDERDEAVEKLEGVTGHLMSVLSSGMCDNHRAEVEGFSAFMQREKDIGCTRCLIDERDRLAGITRELVAAVKARDTHVGNGEVSPALATIARRLRDAVARAEEAMG